MATLEVDTRQENTQLWLRRKDPHCRPQNLDRYELLPATIIAWLQLISSDQPLTPGDYLALPIAKIPP